MSLVVGRFYKLSLQFIEYPGIRHAWKQRGRRPEEAKTLAQRLAEMNYKDPALYYKVDIGFPAAALARKDVLTERIKQRSDLRKNEEVELAARKRTLRIPLDEVYDEWITTDGPAQIKHSADYFGVFDDLFGDAFFLPNVPLGISYNYGKKDIVSRVYRGNMLKPAETGTQPKISFRGDTNAFYTLQLTTPDGHFTQEKGEYLHWLVGNIPGGDSDVLKGQQIVDYLQPFPARGLGFCRYIFVLYRHESKLDLSKFQRTAPCTNLAARTFSTLDFYRELQDFMTPCGLAWFQADWDQTLTAFYQNVLDMPEPAFEYELPPITVPKQKWFPLKKAFNLYLDKYKDRQQLGKELLIEKLKERHPFRPPEKRPKYPLAFKIGPEIPSWLNDDIRRRRMREGKWKFM